MNSLAVAVACVVGLLAFMALSVDARALDSESYFISYVTKKRSVEQEVVIEGNEIKLISVQSTAVLTYDENTIRVLFTKSNDREHCYMMHLDNDKIPGFYGLKEALYSGKNKNGREGIKMPTDTLQVQVVEKPKRIPFPTRMSKLAMDMCTERQLLFLETKEKKATRAVAERRAKREVGWGEIVVIIIVIIILL